MSALDLTYRETLERTTVYRHYHNTMLLTIAILCSSTNLVAHVSCSFPPSESVRNQEEAELRQGLKMMTERERSEKDRVLSNPYSHPLSDSGKFLREQTRPITEGKRTVSESSGSDEDERETDHMTTERDHVTIAGSAELTTHTTHPADCS